MSITSRKDGAATVAGTGHDRPWRRAGPCGLRPQPHPRHPAPPVTVHEVEPSVVVSGAGTRGGRHPRRRHPRRVNVFRPPVPAGARHPGGPPLRQGTTAPRRGRGGRWRYSPQYRIPPPGRTGRVLRADHLGGARPGVVDRPGLPVVNCDPAWSRRLRRHRRAPVRPGGRGHARPHRVGCCPGLVHRLGRHARRLLPGSVAVGALRRPSRPRSGRSHRGRGSPTPTADCSVPGVCSRSGSSGCGSLGLRKTRQATSLRDESVARPVIDDWWNSLDPDLTKVDVPALICGSFSDNNLHSRGSFAGFEKISSTEKHLHTHRGGKWSEFYSDDGRAAQLQFFDRHLRGLDVPVLLPCVSRGPRPGDRVVEVRDEQEWPLARTVTWTPRYLIGNGLAGSPATAAGAIAFGLRRGAVYFDWTVPDDLDSPARWHCVCSSASTAPTTPTSWSGVEKWDGNTYVRSRAPTAAGRDRIAVGWQNVAPATSTRTVTLVPACPGMPGPATRARRRGRAGGGRTGCFLDALPRRRTSPPGRRRPLALA